MRFQPLSEHQLLVFWVQLFALVLLARALGVLMRRIGQPAVIGELAAGVLLGRSVLGVLAPDVWTWLFPDDAVHAGLMSGIGWLGVFLLLLLVGVETDLALVRRLGRAAAWVSAGSVVVPLGCGIALGAVMPAAFMGVAADRTEFALFIATAFVVSSLPVVATVLAELGCMRRNFAQLTLAAGMVNDVVGWVLVGVVAGVVVSGRLALGPVLVTVAGLSVFVLVAFTGGQRLLDALLRRARRQDAGLIGALTIVLLSGLAAAAATQAIGIEGVIGAFFAGIVLGRSKYQLPEVVAQLEAVTLGFFAPVFFARAGLQVDLALLADPVVAGWALAVVAAGTAAKLAGAYGGARLAAISPRESLALGAGLNARGALGIVMAKLGLSLGVVTPAGYTLVVALAVLTSVLAPLLLRGLLHGLEASAEERERLDRERLLGSNVLVRPERVLLPSRGGLNSMLAARVVDLAWPPDVEVAVLSAGDDVPPGEIERLVAVFEGRPVEHEHAAGVDPLAAILDHARLGYGAIGLGATDRKAHGRLISPLVDELLASSPLPILMVRRGAKDEAALVGRFRRILVPVAGTTAGRAALEVAFGIARRVDAEVILAHVLTAPRSAMLAALWSGRRAEHDARRGVGEHLLSEASALASEMGVRASTQLRRGPSAAEDLLRLVAEAEVDLLVVTASVRQLSGRPFLGHGVEHLLERAPCTLAVVATPPGWGGGERGPRAQAPAGAGSSQTSPPSAASPGAKERLTDQVSPKVQK
jgi:Kef-type K+ transport system membrane component KefB/nucleotide-binding universal stress UspA family protein